MKFINYSYHYKPCPHNGANFERPPKFEILKGNKHGYAVKKYMNWARIITLNSYSHNM